MLNIIILMQKIPSLIPFLKNSSQYVLGGAIFILVFSLILFVDTTFRIKNIQYLSTIDDVPVSGLPAIKDRHLFLTTEEEIVDIITRSNPTIKTVTVEKQYPDTISLTFVRYTPKAYLKTVDGYFLLAEEGIVLGKSQAVDNETLPIITYYQSSPFTQYQAGTQLPFQDIRDSIYFIGKLRSMGINIISIDIAGFHMLGLYTEDKKYFFSSEKERNIQIYHLEQAVKRFSTDDQVYETIDVRFEKPVITF